MAHWEPLCTEPFKTATLIKDDRPSDQEKRSLGVHAECGQHLKSKRKQKVQNEPNLPVKYETFVSLGNVIKLVAVHQEEVIMSKKRKTLGHLL